MITSYEFEKLAKAEVMKFYNEQESFSQIGIQDVHMVWFNYTLKNMKGLFFVLKRRDNRYFEITFDNAKGRMYVDIYRKEKNMALSIKEEVE